MDHMTPATPCPMEPDKILLFIADRIQLVPMFVFEPSLEYFNFRKKICFFQTTLTQEWHRREEGWTREQDRLEARIVSLETERARLEMEHKVKGAIHGQDQGNSWQNSTNLSILVKCGQS